MADMGKTLIIFGMIIVALGAILTFVGKVPWLGKLPGDIYIKKDNFTFYFPLATCILLSAFISLIFWLLKK